MVCISNLKNLASKSAIPKTGVMVWYNSISRSGKQRFACSVHANEGLCAVRSVFHSIELWRSRAFERLRFHLP